MYFGKNINFLRKSKKWNQTELGEKIGVSKGQISAYEKEGSFPNLENFIELCRIFSVSEFDVLHKDLEAEGYERVDNLPKTEAEKDELARQVNKLLMHRVRELEREILDSDPALAKKLGIEEDE